MKQVFTKIIILLLFSIFNFSALIAQPTDCVPNSGSDATIIFGQGVVPTLNGNPLPTGAYIVAVFNTSNGLKCAGYNQWQNMPMSISPKGATTGFEGYASGETYKFRIMLPGGDLIQNDKITVAFKSPDGIICLNGNAFVADGISCIQSFTAVMTSSSEDLEKENILSLSPNPTTGLIQISSENQKITALEIYNLDGKLMHLIPEPKDNILDLTHLAPGSYIVKGLANNYAFSKKVVIIN